MQEAIRRLESQLAGESSHVGEAGGSRVHGGSLGASGGFHRSRNHVLQAARVGLVCDVVVEVVVVVIDDLSCIFYSKTISI